MTRELRSHQLPCRAESPVPQAGLRTCRAAGAPSRSVPSVRCKLHCGLQVLQAVQHSIISLQSAESVRSLRNSVLMLLRNQRTPQSSIAWTYCLSRSWTYVVVLPKPAVSTWHSMSGLLLASCTCALASAAQTSMRLVVRAGPVASVVPKCTSCRASATVGPATVLHSGAHSP